ncbi:MAG: O-antigen ligase family protein [Candidatus Gracilibacteria bacterium]|jgi:hypothetical protein
MASNLFTFLRSKAFLWTLAFCIFALPFQTKLLTYEAAWGHGFANPYLSIYFSIFDLALLLSGCFYLLFQKKERTKEQSNPMVLMGLMLFISLASLSLLFSPHTDATLNGFLEVKLLEILLFAILLSREKDKEFLVRIFAWTAAIQALWGISQFIFQTDLGLQVLGEPNLAKEISQLAKWSLGSLEGFRAYGSFPHPNILGAFLALAFFFSLGSKTLKKNEKMGLLTLQGLGLLATFSRSALLALVVLLLISGVLKNHFQNKKYFLLTTVFLVLSIAGFLLWRSPNLLNETAFIERIQGFSTSLEMLKAYPLGVGFSHFTLFMDTVVKTPLMPWEYQPVHNIFLLIMNELGLPSLIILMVFLVSQIFKSKKNFPSLGIIFFFILTGFLDHYWISLDQGRFLGVLALSLLVHSKVQPKKEESPMQSPEAQE